jgi:pyridoxamine 5'-phosphate oxidase
VAPIADLGLDCRRPGDYRTYSVAILAETMSMEFADLRDDLGRIELREADIDPDPFRQFADWMTQASAAGNDDPNAMALATATPDGHPSVRMVLLRGFDAEKGFAFFTNYQSRKAMELAANARAALLFYWPEVVRQVRIEGCVEVTTADESDAYFRSRPFGSRLSAVVSPQSRVIPNRQWLEELVRELEASCPNQVVPRPPFWGGYRVFPNLFEFWQGGNNRLHDRLQYARTEDGKWRIERLGP